MGRLLYTPSQETIDTANITAFKDYFAQKIGRALHSYADLHQASIQEKAAFWDAIRSYFKVIGNWSGPIYKQAAHIKDDQYFPDATLNYAENLLAPFDNPNEEILIFSAEGNNKRRMTASTVKKSVGSWLDFLKEKGFSQGDRMAAVMPNMPETVIAMLGCTALGGVWASCSPDFGADAIIDRFAQINPKVIVIIDHYRYNGKIIAMQEKIATLQEKMPEVEHFVIVPFEEHQHHQDITLGDRALSYDDLLKRPSASLEFTAVPFGAPLFIMFSSGTTGVPKCIIHSVGGTLLQHIKEHRLHCDLNPQDRFFYYTTCGWMMWNWSVTALASGMPLLLYDGSPFAPDHRSLFDYISQEKATIFGTSAKFIDAVRKKHFNPIEEYALDHVKIIASTGSALSEENFEFVYQGIKKDVHLASISGGTDIISCFTLGCPILPVYSGELQSAGLGMDVVIYNEEGHIVTQEKGELVCQSSFPSMPIGFWNDPEGTKYHNAYFNRFDNIWAHGDFAEKNNRDGFIIYGRSDTVLNPGGVRIGTAEIYRQVERLDEIMDSVCVGQDWQEDVRVVLFVKLQEGVDLSDDLIQKIKQEIRQGTSPRHVPSIIKNVPDIPRTKSGKITEIAVRDIIHGKEIKNKGALANPEALEYYRNIL